jgi:hypothetical protein
VVRKPRGDTGKAGKENAPGVKTSPDSTGKSACDTSSEKSRRVLPPTPARKSNVISKLPPGVIAKKNLEKQRRNVSFSSNFEEQNPVERSASSSFQEENPKVEETVSQGETQNDLISAEEEVDLPEENQEHTPIEEDNEATELLNPEEALNSELIINATAAKVRKPQSLPFQCPRVISVSAWPAETPNSWLKVAGEGIFTTSSSSSSSSSSQRRRSQQLSLSLSSPLATGEDSVFSEDGSVNETGCSRSSRLVTESHHESRQSDVEGAEGGVAPPLSSPADQGLTASQEDLNMEIEESMKEIHNGSLLAAATTADVDLMELDTGLTHKMTMPTRTTPTQTTPTKELAMDARTISKVGIMINRFLLRLFTKRLLKDKLNIYMDAFYKL